MIELTPEQIQPTGNSMADVFAQALAEAPIDAVLAADDAPLAPSAPPVPLSTTVAPVASPVQPLAPAVAPVASPNPPADDVPPTTPELPEVMRQVQELTGLLSQATPEAAESFYAALLDVNEPLAVQLVDTLKKHLEGQGVPIATIPVELPPVKFDFASRSADDYDEQTWGDFETAKNDIDAARDAATYWQQQAIQAQQALAQQEPAKPPSATTFIDGRANAIASALAAVPAIAQNKEAYTLVHDSLLTHLQGLPVWNEGLIAAKQGNNLGAYQSGLLIDQAINDYVARAAATLAPAAAAPAPAPPPAVPLVPTGAPAPSTAIPPVTPAPGGSFVDSLLANISQFEQAGAASWMQ